MCFTLFIRSIEHLHRQELLKSSKAFHRRKGENQAYVESAMRQSDMLVWQGCQARDVRILKRCDIQPFPCFS